MGELSILLVFYIVGYIMGLGTTLWIMRWTLKHSGDRVLSHADSVQPTSFTRTTDFDNLIALGEAIIPERRSEVNGG